MEDTPGISKRRKLLPPWKLEEHRKGVVLLPGTWGHLAEAGIAVRLFRGT